MSKKQIIGAIVAAVLFIAIGASSVFSHAISDSFLKETAADLLSGGMEVSLPSEEYIGVVNVYGTIEEQNSASSFTESQSYLHSSTLDYIDLMMEDDNNVAILLDVDSPGGTVYEAEELYLKLQEYKEVTGRPIWTYMRHYAASGGYLVSAASDRICANPNTITGSIGVILSGYDMSGLYEKLGIKSISVTSGPNKDMSSPNEEQLAIYQAEVDEYFARFVEIVADGRNMTEEEVRAIADGRTYTAKQALANGLIDEIALYDDMVAEMRDEVGYVTIYQPDMSDSVLAEFFGKLEEITPKSETEILTELTEKYGSGVPMYYAEELQ